MIDITPPLTFDNGRRNSFKCRLHEILEVLHASSLFILGLFHSDVLVPQNPLCYIAASVEPLAIELNHLLMGNSSVTSMIIKEYLFIAIFVLNLCVQFSSKLNACT